MKHLVHILIVLAVSATLLLGGCGGSTDDSALAANPYQGSYASTLTLDNGKRGDASLTVAADGSAAGTLTVTTPAATARGRDGFEFSNGVINISGEVNHDGSFSMTGTDPLSGGFEISGQLPADGSGSGSISVKAGGNTYTSTITLEQGSGGAALKFSSVTASIDSSDFSGTPYIIISQVAGNYSIVAVPSAQDNSRSFVLNIDSSVKAGDTVDFATSSAVGINYRDTASNDVDWNPTAGKLKIVTLSSTSVKFEFQAVQFASDDASGGFTVNGTLQK